MFLFLAKRLVQLGLPSMRTLRLMTYATIVFGMLAMLASRALYADAREIALGMGHELQHLQEMTHGAYSIALNGARLHRASGHTDASVADVLDRYEAHCRGDLSAFGQSLLSMPRASEPRIQWPLVGALRAGIVRTEGEGRGLVACFAGGGARADVVDLRSRIEAFLRTSDLSHFGHFRYLFVEQSPRGGSHYELLWSDDAIPLGRMFPAEGDVPGDDSSIAPRPPESRRTLVAFAEGMPYAVRMYESRVSRSALHRVFDDALQARGFSLASSSQVDQRAYVGAGGAQVTITTQTAASGTIVTMVEAHGEVLGWKAEVR